LLLLKSEESEDWKPEGLREKFYLLVYPSGLGAKTLGDLLGESFFSAYRGPCTSVKLNVAAFHTEWSAPKLCFLIFKKLASCS
jgi:hypothetical protein